MYTYLFPSVHENEAPGAVGALRLAFAETRLSEQSGLLGKKNKEQIVTKKLKKKGKKKKKRETKREPKKERKKEREKEAGKKKRREKQKRRKTKKGKIYIDICIKNEKEP